MKFRIFSVLKETSVTIDNFPAPGRISFQTSDSMCARSIDKFDMYLKYLPPVYQFSSNFVYYLWTYTETSETSASEFGIYLHIWIGSLRCI